MDGFLWPGRWATGGLIVSYQAYVEEDILVQSGSCIHENSILWLFTLKGRFLAIRHASLVLTSRCKEQTAVCAEAQSTEEGEQGFVVIEIHRTWARLCLGRGRRLHCGKGHGRRR
jgi:hypothetical protein